MAKILVVDDRASVLSAIERGLKPLGHELRMVANGLEAKECLERDSFELLVTDLLMPEGTGFELLDWVKENRSRLPVVVCSAYVKMEPLRNFLGKHLYIVVLKPFRPEAIAEAASKLLKRSTKSRRKTP